MADILYKEESYKVIGCCMKVHAILGPGLLEAVYQEALEKEFIRNSIPHARHPKLSIWYEGEKLKKFYIPDFVCYDKIIIEVKALPFLMAKDYLQSGNYLTITQLRLSLLVNFGTKSLTYKRILNSKVQDI